jgi:ABC-type sugar transport system substrate-binding protein
MVRRRDFLSAAAAGAAATSSSCARSSRRVIGVVPKATSHLFFVSIHSGVRTAAAEFGVDIVWNGPNDETDSGRQIQIVDSMIAQRVDAMAISASIPASTPSATSPLSPPTMPARASRRRGVWRR